MNGGECVVKGGDNPGQDIVWQPRAERRTACLAIRWVTPNSEP